MGSESDLESSYVLVADSWARLRDLDPKNDLLRFAGIDEHEGFAYDEEHLSDAYQRFAKDGTRPRGDRGVTYFNSQYFIALRDAANQIELASRV